MTLQDAELLYRWLIATYGDPTSERLATRAGINRRAKPNGKRCGNNRILHRDGCKHDSGHE